MPVFFLNLKALMFKEDILDFLVGYQFIDDCVELLFWYFSIVVTVESHSNIDASYAIRNYS
jgi:hypothetical protein